MWHTLRNILLGLILTLVWHWMPFFTVHFPGPVLVQPTARRIMWHAHTYSYKQCRHTVRICRLVSKVESGTYGMIINLDSLAVAGLPPASHYSLTLFASLTLGWTALKIWSEVSTNFFAFPDWQMLTIWSTKTTKKKHINKHETPHVIPSLQRRLSTKILPQNNHPILSRLFSPSKYLCCRLEWASWPVRREVKVEGDGINASRCHEVWSPWRQTF